MYILRYGSAVWCKPLCWPLLESSVSSEVGSDPEAIEVIGLSVDSEAKEIEWTLALRHFLKVGRPNKVKSGYPDVVTDRFAIEVDRLANWKEGLGQAYAYAIDTEKEPVVALMRPVGWTDFQAANYAGGLRTRYAAPLAQIFRKKSIADMLNC